MSRVTNDEYNRAKRVFKDFNCKSLGDYNDLYLKTDVIDNFRNTMIDNFRLDPLHYITLPSFTFDVGLFYTGIELELITDFNMYLFLERAKRGGISSIMKKYSKANNKYMKDFNPNETSKYITYLDANNLYGHAMKMVLPYKEHKWNEDEWNTEKILNLKLAKE